MLSNKFLLKTFIDPKKYITSKNEIRFVDYFAFIKL
jgi:hypothetical protein